MNAYGQIRAAKLDRGMRVSPEVQLISYILHVRALLLFQISP